MNSKSGDETNNETNSSRCRIMPRPASSICQFCLKTISTPNWSRHLRTMHMDDITRLQQQQLKRIPGPDMSTGAGYSKMIISGMGPLITPIEHSNHLSMVSQSDNPVKIEPVVQHQNQQLQLEVNNETSTARKKAGMKHVVKTKSAIRLPKDNICPLCSRKTSPGNWCRHLKRHHPEYALAPVNNNEQQNTLEGNFAEQLLQQNPNNNDFTLSVNGDTGQLMDHNRYPMLMIMKMNMKNGDSTSQTIEHPEATMNTTNEMVNALMNVGGDQQQIARWMIINGIDGKAMEKDVDDSVLGVGSNNDSGNVDNGKIKEHRVRRPTNGICQFCMKSISASNWSRHLRLLHTQDIARMSYMDLPAVKTDPSMCETYFSGYDQQQQGQAVATTNIDAVQLLGNLNQPNNDLKPKRDKHAGPTKLMIKKTRSMLKLPKDNICPLCSQKTSPGNWCRHVKRHHPEFAERIDDKQAESMQQHQQLWSATASTVTN